MARTNAPGGRSGVGGLRRRAAGADASLTADSATSAPADGALVARALAGDADAFGLLFRRHSAAVHVFAQRRTRSADLADDITASAFEKAWRSLESLGASDGDKFRPWVFRIAANDMASLMRSRTRRGQREHLAAARGEIPSDGGPIRGDSDGLNAIDAAIDDADVLGALGDLPDRYQEVISLRYLSDLSVAETAAALRISRGNVAVLLHRALAALRNSIEERT